MSTVQSEVRKMGAGSRFNQWINERFPLQKLLREHATDCDCLMSEWTDEPGKPNLSVVDVQRYNREIHVQGYHMRSDCGLVLRTQSIFQIKKD